MEGECAVELNQGILCCPACKGPLSAATHSFRCELCERSFEIVNGIPDFFVVESVQDAIDEPNKTWTCPEIVEARDTVYRLCSRELRGMNFCMQKIAKRTYAGCRVLEVGMGTGHFTRWLAEVSKPGTEVYAFDFSWPIIEKAKKNTAGLGGVALFRANARGRLPFEEGTFDILFLRLAPLGPHGVPNVQAGLELLKPGGWYFEAVWYQEQFETPPTEWAISHGYESAEHHTWQYWRALTEEESLAKKVEREHLVSQFAKANRPIRESLCQLTAEGVLEMTHENLLIARKPSCQSSGALNQIDHAS
jgi:SAM-dependent methyltransferase